MIRLRNLVVFTAGIIQFQTPPWLWRRAWREVQADHLAEVRKAIWEAKKQGLIYEDREGKLRIRNSNFRPH